MVLIVCSMPALATDGQIRFQGAVVVPTQSLPTMNISATLSSTATHPPTKAVSLIHMPLRVALAAHDPLLDYFAQHVALDQAQLIVATYP